MNLLYLKILKQQVLKVKIEQGHVGVGLHYLLLNLK